MSHFESGRLVCIEILLVLSPLSCVETNLGKIQNLSQRADKMVSRGISRDQTDCIVQHIDDVTFDLLGSERGRSDDWFLYFRSSAGKYCKYGGASCRGRCLTLPLRHNFACHM